jgi:diaminopimelate dehydrogenase
MGPRRTVAVSRPLALLVPKGHTETTDRPGISLHHTLSARAVAGVRDALCTELRSADGNTQRYVYVELAPGADRERVAEAIRSEPLFLEEETLVFPVESVAALEEEGRGIVLERRGTAGRTGHQMLLLEARFDAPSLAAQVMLAAARALPDLPPGARSLSEVPLSLLLDSHPMTFGREAI